MKSLDSNSIIQLIKNAIKNNKKNLIFIYAIYLIALFALILANFNYIDDIGRSVLGYFDFTYWNRYTSLFLAKLLSLNNDFFINIFPLSLFISIFFLSLASLIMIKIINKDLLDSKLALLASISVGLSPYYLENLSFKFDSPFMALSVLVSILPFLFLKDKRIFIIISSICLLIMLTTYQASSGIYIILSIFLAFKSILKGEYHKACYIALISIVSYIIAGVIFFYLIYTPQTGYVSSQAVFFGYIAKGVIKNISTYLNYIYSDMGGGSKVLLALAFSFGILFIIKNTLESRINKILAFSLSIIILPLMFILAFGLYIILLNPSFFTRSFIGFGIFLTIIALDSIYFKNKYFKIINYILIIPFAWYLISFATYYGQSLREHDNYQRFRYTLLAGDLATILDNKDRNKDNKFNIIFAGDAGDSPTIVKSKLEYPIIKRLVPKLQRNSGWGIEALKYYGINALPTSYTKEFQDLPKTLLVSNYYHKIYKLQKQDKIYYLVEFINH